MSSKMRSTAGALMVTLLTVGASAVLVRAASTNTRFNTEVQRLRQQWQTQQEAEGLAGSQQRKTLYGKYSTPQLTLARVVQVAPGQGAKISVTGSFPANTSFVMENDQVTLDGGAVTGKTFTATVTAAPDALPGFGRLFAYAPVSGAYTSLPAVFVGTPATFALQASNGWTVKVVPQAASFMLTETEASVSYKAEFYKTGEAKAFETATGRLTIESGRPPSSELSFSLTAGLAGSAMQEMQALQEQMSDMNAFMKLSDKQRDALMAKLEDVGNRLSKEQEAMVADPSAIQRKQDAFGCSHIRLTFSGSAATGVISCGKDVGRLDVTGARQ